MRRFRKQRRPGNRPMTSTQAARVMAAKVDHVCIPCLVWHRLGHMPREDVATCCDYDHAKSGNLRRGHDHGFASCLWHHRRRIGDGWTFAAMATHFGPSLMDGSRLFRDTYGSDDDLIALQDDILEGRQAA